MTEHSQPTPPPPPRRQNAGVFIRSPVRPTMDCPKAHPIGTIVAVIGIMWTMNSLPVTGKPSELAAYAAKVGGFSILLSVLFDLSRGVANIVRADILAMLAFYFLTLFEFLFEQRLFDFESHLSSTYTGTQLVLTGFLGLLIGRHFFHPKKQPFERIMTYQVPAGLLLILFWAAFCIGYLHQWSHPKVNYDMVKWMDFQMAARFEQPWGRARLGDWSALIYELNMLLNLVPPLAGIILARRHRFGMLGLTAVTLAYLLVLFIAYAGGTRNYLATYLVTFLIGYAMAAGERRRKEIVLLGAAAFALMVFGTVTMIHIRTVGLKKYLAGENKVTVGKAESLYVDYNLFNICELTTVFPKRADYLGSEVFIVAVTRPIPRAIWKGKPEGLTHSIEKALGYNAGNVTISASFVGESYMAGGSVCVLLVALFFGAVNGWWSHVSSPRNSELGILIYASGFFAAVISMRSVFMYTTALLPTIAAIVGTTWLVNYLSEQVRRFAFSTSNRTGSIRQPPQRPGPKTRPPQLPNNNATPE